MLAKFGLLFAIGVLSVNSFGQNKCDLQFGVYEFKEDGSSEQFPVRDAKITLVDAKTKKPLKISPKAETSTFAEVSEGDYEISIEKPGFKRSLTNMTTDCGQADAQNTLSNIVFLWKGSSQETVDLGAPGRSTGKQLTAYEIPGGEPANSLAIVLAKPEYPKAALAVKATGAVDVQVTINELGYVISAQAVSGHPLLRAAAVKAARASKFRMTLLEGIPVKVTGVIVYNFVP